MANRHAMPLRVRLIVLSLDTPLAVKLGEIIAHAIGIDQVSGRYIEILLWAREGVTTFLELEPLSRGTPRLPSVESIRRPPGDLYNKIWN